MEIYIEKEGRGGNNKKIINKHLATFLFNKAAHN